MCRGCGRPEETAGSVVVPPGITACRGAHARAYDDHRARGARPARSGRDAPPASDPAKAPTPSSTAVVTPSPTATTATSGAAQAAASAAIRKALTKAQLTTAQVKLVRQKEIDAREPRPGRAHVHRLRLRQGRRVGLRPRRPDPVVVAEQGLGLAGPDQGPGQDRQRGRGLPARRRGGGPEGLPARAEDLPQDHVRQGRVRRRQGGQGPGRPAQGHGCPQPGDHLQEQGDDHRLHRRHPGRQRARPAVRRGRVDRPEGGCWPTAPGCSRTFAKQVAAAGVCGRHADGTAAGTA